MANDDSKIKQNVEMDMNGAKVHDSTIIGNVINQYQNCVFVEDSDRRYSERATPAEILRDLNAQNEQSKTKGKQGGGEKGEDNGNKNVDDNRLALFVSCCQKINGKNQLDRASFNVIKNCTQYVSDRQPVVFISAPTYRPGSDEYTFEFKCAEELKRQLDARGIMSFWWKSFNSCAIGDVEFEWDRYKDQILIGAKINYGLAMSSVFIGFSAEGGTFEKNKNCLSEFKKFGVLSGKEVAKQFVEFPYIESVLNGEDISKSACRMLEAALKKDLPKKRNFYIVSDREKEDLESWLGNVGEKDKSVRTVQQSCQNEDEKIKLYVVEALKCVQEHIRGFFSSGTSRYEKNVLKRRTSDVKKNRWGTSRYEKNVLKRINELAKGECKFHTFLNLKDKKQEISYEEYQKLSSNGKMSIWSGFHDGCNTPSDWFFKYTVIDEDGNDVTIAAPNPTDRHFEMFLERDYTANDAYPCVKLCFVVNDWNISLINDRCDTNASLLSRGREYVYSAKASRSANSKLYEYKCFRVLDENNKRTQKYTIGTGEGHEYLSYSNAVNGGKAYIEGSEITESKKFMRTIEFYNADDEKSVARFYVYAMIIKKAVVNYQILGSGGSSYKIETSVKLKRNINVSLVNDVLKHYEDESELESWVLKAGKTAHSAPRESDRSKDDGHSDLRLVFRDDEEKDNAFVVLRKAPSVHSRKRLISSGKSPLQCIYCAQNWPKKLLPNSGVRERNKNLECTNNPKVKQPLPKGYGDKSIGAVVAMVGAPGSGKSMFISRLFENVVVQLDQLAALDKVSRRTIQPVVQRAFKNIGIKGYFFPDFSNDENGDGVSYDMSLYQSPPSRTSKTLNAILKNSPFVCEIGNEDSGLNYLSFFDIPGELLENGKSDDLNEYVCLGANIWIICVNSEKIEQCSNVVKYLIKLLNARDNSHKRRPKKKPIAVAVVMCKADQFAHKIDSNAMVNTMSPRIDYRYSGSMLEQYIDECSDEVREYIRLDSQTFGKELIGMIEGNFEFVKYFAVSSLGCKNSVELRPAYDLLGEVEEVVGRDGSLTYNIKSNGKVEQNVSINNDNITAIPKYLVNPYGMENVLAWICYQIGILR